jgi:hypothetical protein
MNILNHSHEALGSDSALMFREHLTRAFGHLHKAGDSYTKM